MFFSKKVNMDMYCLRYEMDVVQKEKEMLEEENKRLREFIFLSLDAIHHVKESDESLKDDLELKNVRKFTEILRNVHYGTDSKSLEVTNEFIKKIRLDLSNKDILEEIEDFYNKNIRGN